MITQKEELIKKRSKTAPPVYLLYNWKGLCKWAYLEGVFLVDPNYEAEFKAEHGAA